MLRESSGRLLPSPGWNPTIARRSAPLRPSSNAIVPPKQYPNAAVRPASTRGSASNGVESGAGESPDLVRVVHQFAEPSLGTIER